VITVASIALLSMALVTLTVQIGVMQIWKLSPKVLLRTAYFIFAGVLLLFAYSETLLMMYIAYGGMGMSFALAAPGLNAAGSLAVETNEQGAVAGLLSAAPAFGMVFGPALGGFVYNIAPNLPMIGGAVLSVLVGLYFLTVRIPDPQSGQPGTPAD
jgi:MFS family permease